MENYCYYPECSELALFSFELMNCVHKICLEHALVFMKTEEISIGDLKVILNSLSDKEQLTSFLASFYEIRDFSASQEHRLREIYGETRVTKIFQLLQRDQDQFKELLKGEYSIYNFTYDLNYANIKDLLLQFYNIGYISPEIAKAIVKQASELTSLERYSESEPLLTAALEFYQHFDTTEEANTIFELGRIYDEMQEISKAHDFFRKSLDLRRSRLSENHPDIAQSLCYIGRVLNGYSKYNESVDFSNQALNILRMSVGEENSVAAQCYHNIAYASSYQKKHQESLQAYEKALEIRLNVFGKDDWSVVRTLRNIANRLKYMEKYKESVSTYIECLEVQKRLRGYYHKDVAQTYVDIAYVFEDEKNYSVCLDYLFKALEIFTETVGEEHSLTLKIQAKIAIIYFHLYRYRDSLQYYKKILPLQVKTHGEGSKEVLETKTNMGLIYNKTKKYDKALKILKTCCKQELDRYGKEILASTYIIIGSNYRAQKEFSKGLKYYRKGLQVGIKYKGANTTIVIDSLFNIAAIYFEVGNYEEAYAYFKRSYEFRSLYFPNENELISSAKKWMNTSKKRILLID